LTPFFQVQFNGLRLPPGTKKQAKCLPATYWSTSSTKHYFTKNTSPVFFPRPSSLRPVLEYQPRAPLADRQPAWESGLVQRILAEKNGKKYALAGQKLVIK